MKLQLQSHASEGLNDRMAHVRNFHFLISDIKIDQGYMQSHNQAVSAPIKLQNSLTWGASTIKLEGGCPGNPPMQRSSYGTGEWSSWLCGGVERLPKKTELVGGWNIRCTYHNCGKRVNLILKSWFSEEFCEFSDVCFYSFLYCLVIFHEVPTATDTSSRVLFYMRFGLEELENYNVVIIPFQELFIQ